MATEPNDKRVVTTDALETLGQIHTRRERRDAIHLAVEPVEAADVLWPGDRIAVIDGKAFRTENNPTGIVDPFLTGEILQGQRFWFVMMPRMVHSLRHVWTHPAFPPEPGTEDVPHNHPDQLSPRQEAEASLRTQAEAMGYTYARLMALADTWLNSQEYIMDNTESYKGVFDAEAFWKAYDTVRGVVTPESLRDCFFTCSC